MRVLVLLAAFLVGCEDVPWSPQKRVNEGTTEVCVNGVVYYHFKHGMSPAFNPDSTVKTCPPKGTR